MHTAPAPPLRILTAVVFAALAAGAGAQTTPAKPAGPPPGTNLLASYGGFEKFSTTDNVWDGVDSTGKLSGGRATLDLLLESGRFGDASAPPSVAFTDFNGDGADDIFLASPDGYYYAYFNQGTKAAPKFTNAEILPIFLSFPSLDFAKADFGWPLDRRRGIRANLIPWKTQSPDILLGNYIGEIMLVPNKGSKMSPDFRMPGDLNELIVPTDTAGKLWGNLLAPVGYDMNKDGKLDLLVGEGSYSANSIHLFLNQGSTPNPKFDIKERYFLVYGDGREQLAPTLVDYNNDGLIDIIVGDRRGDVSLHLNPGSNWKPGDDFPITRMLQFGTAARLGSAVTPYAGDFNGDGKFDLLLGRTNGRVSVALNTGTPQEPKFATPVDIDGVNVGPPRYKIPRGWLLSNGAQYGNAYAFVSAVAVEDDATLNPPEGKSALKAGYEQSPNKIIPPPNLTFGAGRKNKEAWGSNAQSGIYVNSPGHRARYFSNRTFILTTDAKLAFKYGSTYQVAFKVKGNRVTNGEWEVGIRGYKRLSEPKKTVGERGSVEFTYNDIHERLQDGGQISAAAEWKEVTATVQAVFKEPELKKLNGQLVADGYLTFIFELNSPDAVLYIDDVRIVEKT